MLLHGCRGYMNVPQHKDVWSILLLAEGPHRSFIHRRDAIAHTSIFLRNFGFNVYECVYLVIGVKIHSYSNLSWILLKIPCWELGTHNWFFVRILLHLLASSYLSSFHVCKQLKHEVSSYDTRLFIASCILIKKWVAS